MTNKRNISQIVGRDLCTGCGFCAGLCPKEAIKITLDHSGFFTPVINHNILCTNCGICLDVCPSSSLNSNQQKNSGEPAKLFGKYRETYFGNATDLKVRYNASSGGVITALLTYLLSQKIIDGAVVSVMGDNDPFHARAIIATCEADVINATSSKYTPVSMHEVIGHIKKAADTKKFAFVGLPCHLAALSKAERKFSKLKAKIILKIGLYCYSTPSVEATNYVLKRLSIPKKEVTEIKYRGNGWPGNLTVTLSHNRQVTSAFTMYSSFGFLEYFCKKRCILCADQTAECADISVADPWTLYSDICDNGQRLGYSLVIARTVEGLKFLNDASYSGFIELSPVSAHKMVQSTTILKKTNKNSMAVKFLLGVTLPNQVYSLPLGLNSTIWLFRYRFFSYFAKNKKAWPLLTLFIKAHAMLSKIPHRG